MREREYTIVVVRQSAKVVCTASRAQQQLNLSRAFMGKVNYKKARTSPKH